MLKHMFTNGGFGTHVSLPDSSIVMEPRIEPNRYRTNGNPNSSRVQQFPLNASNLNTSKHSLCGNSVISPTNKSLNGGLNISRVTNKSTVNKFMHKSKQVGIKEMLVSLGLLCLVSLLLALLSLIFLLKISPVTSSDIRELLRAEQLTIITAEEYVVVYEVTLALCALTLSLNLCCLLVCAVQFLFAVKLVKSPHGGSDRTNKYLQKSSISRVCAVGGFFISIPVFLTGIILYTFIQFHSTPAIVTSVFIGLAIIFCGCAMVHNVFIWQREKTNAVKEMTLAQQHEQSHMTHYSTATHNNISTNPIGNSTINPLNIPISNPLALNQSHISQYNHSFIHSPGTQLHPPGPYVVRPSTTTPPTGQDNIVKIAHPREASGSVSPGMPTQQMDMSSVATTNSPHELSTLV